MKILQAEVYNFGSYKHLKFNFSNQGLTLISGPTGSGKSTLMDIVSWVLFGKTAKGGAVDEIRTWGSNTVTSGTITLQNVTIVRVRGPNQNDLMYYLPENLAESIRGKDIPDTQKIINNILGFDYNLYMSGAYFHEFSETAQFFTANAKSRREITEQLVDLKLSTSLSDKNRVESKKVTKLLEELKIFKFETITKLKSITQAIKEDKILANKWEEIKILRLTELEAAKTSFDKQSDKRNEKAKKEYAKITKEIESTIKELEEQLIPEADILFYKSSLAEERKALNLTKGKRCVVCGSIPGSEKEMLLISKEHELSKKEALNESTFRAINYKKKELLRHLSSKLHDKKEENPYFRQISAIKAEQNPHVSSVTARTEQKNQLENELKQIEASIQISEMELDDLDVLSNVIDSFRSLLIETTTVDLQDNTNKILKEYFDGEIQVEFEISDKDKLNVVIKKDENLATFTQLSKGQRQLLKLSFGISVMLCIKKHHSMNFEALFFDEAFDGLDDIFKVKTYDLLQNLAVDYNSVFVVEHNEALKTLFPNRYDVSLSEEGSRIAET